MPTAALEIMRTIEEMDDNNARAIFDWLSVRFQSTPAQVRWEDIEEDEPDEFDIEMIQAINNDPDCNEFASEEEMFNRLLSHN